MRWFNINKLISHYKYRFVPWQMLNWKQSTVKNILELEHSILQEQENDYLSLLENFLETLHRKHDIDSQLLMYDCFGFSIVKKKSTIKSAGDGVFVETGIVPKFSIVAMYPGTVYYPMEPIFFQSICNQFILKCLDGVFVDGKNTSLSKRIFRSCAQRDRIGPYASCDISWLTNSRKNPLAIGQFINNETPSFPANVTYQELDIPVSFERYLLQYIPNVNFMSRAHLDDFGGGECTVRAVVLIALRHIHEGEEFFSSYFTQVQVN